VSPLVYHNQLTQCTLQSQQSIKPGQYSVKEFFGNAEKIVLTSQDGTNYRMKSEILEYAKPIDEYE